MTTEIPPRWTQPLASDLDQPYFHRLQEFVDAERCSHLVFPPEADVFRALDETQPGMVRVVILGQDPYHDQGQAHGLAFSVPPGQKIPPSLKNIYKELKTDLPGFEIPDHGCLIPWARQGVLLLNSVLTVRAHAANSHRGKGWEQFTDAVLHVVNASESQVVFVLWGDHARKKASMLDATRHFVIESAHPSPLSAYRGFFGSRPFSQINARLQSWGTPAIDWRL